MRDLKIIFFYCCRALGLFRIARFLSQKQLNILCYHGFSQQDEHLFRPKLFMQAKTFETRLDYLEKQGYKVCTLDEGLGNLQKGSPVKNAVVITVDDGWLGTYLLAHPLLKERGLPWTLYLTTYYAAYPVQVINIVIQYLLWKTRVKQVDISSLVVGSSELVKCSSEIEKNKLFNLLNDYCNKLQPVSLRQEFVTKLACLLEIDWAPYVEEGLFRLITEEQCRSLAMDGVAIELHTHRHRLPDDSEEAMLAELAENAEWIREKVGVTPRHFCYPSGLYNSTQLEWLGKTNLVSATTCLPGLNNKNTPVLEMNRFLDGENIHQIEFEAEVSGFKALLRR